MNDLTPNNHKFRVLGIFSPDEVLEYTVDLSNSDDRRDYTADGKVWSVRMSSQRYRVFRANPSCVVCGKSGSIMVLERNWNSDSNFPPHFNFYHVKDDGAWLLMTKDHIKPIANGGRNRFDNYQTMCCECNQVKADKPLTCDQVRAEVEMKKDRHRVDIIEVGPILPHPNSEVRKMELTHVLGWQCCVGKGQFQEGGKAIYIEPDYLCCTDRPYFEFLKSKEGRTQERIKVRRFKGTISQGLMISVPDELADLPVGTNVIEQLGIKRYEPPMPKSTGGDFIGAPSGLYCPKFDVENWQRWTVQFVDNELVYVTEKLHGASARYCVAKNTDGEWVQFCGTRVNWLKEDEKNIWWMAFRQCPAIGEWCKANLGKILYGEVFGQVQSLKYGAGRNDVFFAEFGILDQNTWLDFDEARKSADEYRVPCVPLLYFGPFDIEKIKALAEGNSSWPGANHMREGVVILPEFERTDQSLGRVQLKIVGNRYLEKGK